MYVFVQNEPEIPLPVTSQETCLSFSSLMLRISLQVDG